MKDVNRDDAKFKVAQSESKVHQNPESQSTHEYDSDQEEDKIQIFHHLLQTTKINMSFLITAQSDVTKPNLSRWT